MLKIKTTDHPTSCNDLIITLLIASLLILCTFYWLYTGGENTQIINQQLKFDITLLKQNAVSKQKYSQSLTSKLKQLNLKLKSQVLQLNKSFASIKNYEATIQQTKISQAHNKQALINKISSLQTNINQQQIVIDQIKQQKSDLTSQLLFSNKSLLETKISQTHNKQALINKISSLQTNINQQQIDIDQIKQQKSDVTSQLLISNKNRLETKTSQAHNKQALINKISSLQTRLNQQQIDIAQIKQQKSDVTSQLLLSNKSLLETRILSEQQFDEFKVLKNNFLQTEIDSKNRLKEIAEWQVEVEKLKKQLANTKIKMSQPKQRFTVFEMDQDILFNNGQASLKAEGKEALDTLAKIFKQYPKRQIAIQGHSDNQSLGPKLKNKYNSNWELAAARAASAIYYLQHNKSISPQRIILVSYSHYRPKHQGNSAHDLANNRRIEITLMPKSFDFIRGSLKMTDN